MPTPTTPQRIRPGDILYTMLEDLCHEAMRLEIHDADAREGWRAHCVQLLAAVPDPMQRLAWAMSLAQALASRSNLPVSVVMGYLRNIQPAQ